MQQLLSQLGINWELLVSQAVNFALLLIVLRLFVYKPLLKLLHDRRARIQDGFVFWPSTTDPLFGLVGTFDPSRLDGNGFPSSDHRLTAIDVRFPRR